MRKVFYIFLSSVFLFIILLSIKVCVADYSKIDSDFSPHIAFSIASADAVIPIKTTQSSLVCFNSVALEIHKEKSSYFLDSKRMNCSQGALKLCLFDRIKPSLLLGIILSKESNNSFSDPHSAWFYCNLILYLYLCVHLQWASWYKAINKFHPISQPHESKYTTYYKAF